MSSVQEAFKKYDKSRQETIAYHGGTCNQHDFEAGYKAAIAATADQFRQAKVEVLREAANECEGMFQEYNCDGTERNMSYVCAERLRHMADELEKQK